MLDTDNRDDSDNETDFEFMFKEKNPEDSVFYFRQIEVHYTAEICEVTYKFNFDNTIDLSCTLIVEKVSDIERGAFRRMILSIGLCALPWYWMGFASKQIVVEESVSVDLSDGMLAFWNILYENVLLEFMFVNKLKWAVPHLEVKRGRESEVVEGRESEVVEGRESEVVVGNYEVEGHTNIMKDVIKKIEMVKKTEINYDTKNNCTTLDNDRNNQDKKHNAIVYQKPYEYLPLSLPQTNEILLPLGGGKDSLVAWDRACKYGKNPVLMYVADGINEFEDNWRLNKIVQTIGTGVCLVKHVFTNPLFEQRARSYLKPCGHPWAALVMFDSVLVSASLGIGTVSLGYEKSADYGNGICIDGVEVNHQYDKSSNFLTLASEYVRTFLSPKLVLESVLSNMWELEITRTFCEEPSLQPFHSLFLSCNEPVCYIRSADFINKIENYHENENEKKIEKDEENEENSRLNAEQIKLFSVKIDSKENRNRKKDKNKNKKGKEKENENESNILLEEMKISEIIKNKKSCCEWCCECEKCAFIFLLFSAWLSPKEVSRIFGHNLFLNKSLLETFLSLIGAEGRKKPFECVGTFAEAKAAFHLTLLRYEIERRKSKNEDIEEYDSNSNSDNDSISNSDNYNNNNDNDNCNYNNNHNYNNNCNYNNNHNYNNEENDIERKTKKMQTVEKNNEIKTKEKNSEIQEILIEIEGREIGREKGRDNVKEIQKSKMNDNLTDQRILNKNQIKESKLFSFSTLSYLPFVLQKMILFVDYSNDINNNNNDNDNDDNNDSNDSNNDDNNNSNNNDNNNNSSNNNNNNNDSNDSNNNDNYIHSNKINDINNDNCMKSIYSNLNNRNNEIDDATINKILEFWNVL